MTNKIKTLFDAVRSEEKLKSDITLYLEKEIYRRKKSKRHVRLKRYAVVLASVTVFFLSGIFTYILYFVPFAYVDVDVNPSIELMLNRFDRVIDTHAYNDEGNDIINGLSLTHKSYEDALVIIMESITMQGYFKGDGLISVTLQINDKSREELLLVNIRTGIEEYMTKHHHTAQIDIFPVSDDIRSLSYEQGISPAKYIAIQELIRVDPNASIDCCRNHSISEIKEEVWEHGHHHSGSSSDEHHTPATNSKGHCKTGH